MYPEILKFDRNIFRRIFVRLTRHTHSNACCVYIRTLCTYRRIREGIFCRPFPRERAFDTPGSFSLGSLLYVRTHRKTSLPTPCCSLPTPNRVRSSPLRTDRVTGARARRPRRRNFRTDVPTNPESSSPRAVGSPYEKRENVSPTPVKLLLSPRFVHSVPFARNPTDVRPVSCRSIPDNTETVGPSFVRFQ